MDLGPQPDSQGAGWLRASRRQSWRAHVSNWSERDLFEAIADLANRYRTEPFDSHPGDRTILDELLRRLTGRLEQWASDFERAPPGAAEMKLLYDFQHDLQDTYDYLSSLFHQRRCLYNLVDPAEWPYVVRPQIRDALDTYYRPAIVACTSYIERLKRGTVTYDDIIMLIGLATNFARKMREIVDYL